MNERVKQRVVGVIVIVALAVIFVPLMFDLRQQPAMDTQLSPVPPMPDDLHPLTLPLDSSDVTTPEAMAPSADRHAAEANNSPPVPEKTFQSEANPLAQAWVVQLGSFEEEKNAQALTNRLRQEGFHAFVEEVADSKNGSFRVRVGPEVTRAGADAIKAKLQKQMKLQAMVMAYHIK